MEQRRPVSQRYAPIKRLGSPQENTAIGLNQWVTVSGRERYLCSPCVLDWVWIKFPFLFTRKNTEAKDGNSIQCYLISTFYNIRLSQSSFTKGPGLRPPQSKPRVTVAWKNFLTNRKKPWAEPVIIMIIIIDNNFLQLKKRFLVQLTSNEEGSEVRMRATVWKGFWLVEKEESLSRHCVKGILIGGEGRIPFAPLCERDSDWWGRKNWQTFYWHGHWYMMTSLL